MLPDVPDDLKFMLPYLQRASELKMKDPVMSYYCTFYAANIALKKSYPKNQVNDGFLMALLDELGAEKEALIEEDAMKDNEAGKKHVLQFALKVFLAADNEDRAGQATKKTARFFFIAAQFLEVLRVFGDDAGEEVEERIRYAKWKASDIAKAINEGRQPQPGPPTAEADTERRGSGNESSLPSLTGSYQQSPHSPPPVQQPPPQQPQQPRPLYSPPPPPVQQQPPPPMQQQHFSPPPAQHHQTPPQQPQQQVAPQRYSPPVLSDVDPAKLADAEKHARYAISALQFEDVPTAIRELEHALAILRR